MAGIPPLPFIQITRLDDDDGDRRPHVATEREIRSIHNDPRVVERDKTVGLSFVAQSVRLLGCRAKMLASLMLGAWVGRHAFRQVLMSLKGGRCLRESPPMRKNSTHECVRR